MKILLVEDDEGIIQIIRYILEDAHHTVLSANNENEIKAVLSQENVELLLMDVSLQVGDGGKISKKLKSEKVYQALPIVLMSAHHDLKDIAHKANADSFLKKPFDIEDLLSVVNKFAV